LYPAWDRQRPATLSRTIIAQVIRGEIGFRGVLVSDDLAMNALEGAPETRALACLEAGCDVALYCPGDAEGTEAVLRAAPPLTEAARARLAAARATAAARAVPLDEAALAAERDRLLATA
jgi:beta-N-acetylhexosaminidase